MSTAEPFMPNIDPERERDASAEVDDDLALATADDDAATGDAEAPASEQQDPAAPETRDAAFRTPTPGDALDADELADES